MKKALITGVTGQDGSYLAHFLLRKVIKFMGSAAEFQAQTSNGSNIS